MRTIEQMTDAEIVAAVRGRTHLLVPVANSMHGVVSRGMVDLTDALPHGGSIYVDGLTVDEAGALARDAMLAANERADYLAQCDSD